jgi:hypothetical protein
VTRLAVALVLVAAVAAAVAATRAAPARAQREDVTLRVERFWSEACKCHKYRFSGTISSGAANEYIAVLQQVCGKAFSTAIAGASTRAGGFWEAESNGPVGTGTFRARWGNHLSDPVTYRAELSIWIAQLGRGRVRVSVSSFGVPLKLKGKFVELQRLSAGQWTRIRRARFSARRPGAFSATFTIKRRGLALRAFVPAESAAPCYAATASETWTSGAALPAGSGRVIDRTYVCSVAMWGGIRQLSVGAAGLVPTELVPRRGISASSPWIPDGALAGASSESLWLNPTRCAASPARVPFVSRGLGGGAVGNSRRSFECETPSRVLLRLRAVFAAPTALAEDRTRDYRQLVANGEVTEAALAVRTLSGKRFALASLAASGAVRLFVAPSCVDDS